MDYNSLDELEPYGSNWTAKVRVTRMWEAMNMKLINELINMDMILFDIPLAPRPNTRKLVDKCDP